MFGAARGAQRHFVVQFDRPLTPGDRGVVANIGLSLLASLGDNAFFASVAPTGLDAGALGRMASLRVAMPVERSWKLHPLLSDGAVPAWARRPPEAGRASQAADGPKAVVCVLFHADVALDTDAVRIVRRHQGEVRSKLHTVNGLVVELPTLAIFPLADEDAIQWIEPPLPPLEGTNNSNRIITQADQAQAAPYGLDGSGVSVLVYDGGNVDPTHPDFGGRVAVRDMGGTFDHPTHVAGTIGGNGAASGGLYRGMAPGVHIESYSFEADHPFEFGWLYTDPGDIELDYGEAIRVHGADIANNSIGTNTCANGFPCEITGDYGVTDGVLDAIVRGGLGEPFRIIWANGNERNHRGTCPTGHCCRCIDEGVHTPEGYHSTAPPACAKNPIAVGALNSNDDSMTWFSSWGPCDDGRLKPDISAPGCQSDDDMGVTSCLIGGGYGSYCGTSMAAPTVTGLCALVIQDYRTQYPGRGDPRNSTLKALLAHNAADLGAPGPDYQSGYGSVRIRDTIDFVRGGSFAEQRIEQGGFSVYMVAVPPGASQLKVTLAWDDVPGAPNVTPALVNDLDLEVFDPGGNRHFPWTLDPDNPGLPAVRTQPDHVNNMEQVAVDLPAPGVWRISVVGFSVPQGPQWFSLCATPQLQRDCDGNGIPDDAQIAADPSLDCTGNGTLDSCEPDCNSNGVADSCDIAAGISSDCNSNGVPDSCDLAGGMSADCNGNGVPDECDVAGGMASDCNGNRIPDSCETDCNGNGVPDDCDIAHGTSGDCNGNGVPDSCDIAGGFSRDDNASGTPDECEGPVLYVDSRAAGLNNGTSWANAYTGLERALTVAANSPGVTAVWVAAGTYYPTATTKRGVSFRLRSGLAVYGGFAGTEDTAAGRNWAAHRTILSGDIGVAGNDTDNSFHVVVANDVNSTGVLDGFTITGGNADGPSRLLHDRGGGLLNTLGGPTLGHCLFLGNKAGVDNPGGGGGIYSSGGLTLTDCTFVGNTAGFGAAIHIAEAGTATLRRCMFHDNSAEIDGGAVFLAANTIVSLHGCAFTRNTAYEGGALAFVSAGPIVEDCLFQANSAPQNFGGAVLNVGGNPTFLNCTFTANTAMLHGGAVTNWQHCNASFTGCTFLRNAATHPAAGHGGVMHNRASTTLLRNCLLVDNTAGQFGGAISDTESYSTLDNSTLQGNSTAGGGGAVFAQWPGNLTVSRSILWGNTAVLGPELYLSDRTTAEVHYSDLQGGPLAIHRVAAGPVTWGAGNIDLDPLLVSTPYDAYFLSQTAAGQASDSPCLDAGGETATALGLDCCTTRTDGLPDAGVVDMGYHHRVPDCNTNGVPDYRDIADGTSLDCPGAGNDVPDECEPDCDANGTVDSCEIALAGATDCDRNWIPDACDAPRDCNGNGVYDPCDIRGGLSADCDGNGIPDECQPDCDGDGIPDVCELPPFGPSADCNANTVPDECDIDHDTSRDCDANRVPDECQPDCNTNGLADPCDLTGGTSADCNSNGVPDECDLASGSRDENGNLVPDECETDCNSNGVADLFDIAHKTSTDCDGNGVPDECEPDCNANAITDACDLAVGSSRDCDGNGVPDECDLAGGRPDCNGNGVPDDCELVGGAWTLTLLNPLPASSNSFAGVVAVMGDNFLVGSPADDTAGVNAGAVYLFDGRTGALLRTFLSPSAHEDDFFGAALAVVGSNVLVGVPGDDTAGTDSGAAFLLDGATGGLLQTFLNPSPDPDDQFGATLEAVGGSVLIGAWLDDTATQDAGAAYLFDAATGALQHTLLSPSPRAGDYFGLAVAGVGASALVGAPGDDSAATNAGAVYAYDAGTGALQRTFLSPSPDPYDAFGVAVAGAGRRVLVGAYLDDTLGTNAGAAYLFDSDNGALLRTITSLSPAPGDQFGQVVASVDGNVLVGALLADDGAVNTGVAHLIDARTGAVLQTFRNPTPGENDLFSGSLAGAGGRVIVGSWRDDTAGPDAGAAYVFHVALDCNANATPDACDIAAGVSADRNRDGVPDECGVCGDLDNDGDVDGDDFAVFLASFGYGPGSAHYAPGADTDGDGTVTLVDYQSWLRCYRAFVGNMNAAAPAPGLPDDLDADHDVDLLDFAALQRCVAGGSVPAFPCALKFDANHDGRVDTLDLSGFAASLGGP